MKRPVFFLESIPSYANQLDEQRQVSDVTGSGAKMAQIGGHDVSLRKNYRKSHGNKKKDEGRISEC